MRRYLFAVIGTAAASLLLLFLFSIYLFSRNLEQARDKSEKSMLDLARYIEEHFDAEYFSLVFSLRPSDTTEAAEARRDNWLSRLTRATGLERAVVIDSPGVVYATSHSLIQQGELIHPYLVDKDSFERAWRDNRPLFTPVIEIEGFHFQSLYFPGRVGDRPHMVILEVDRNYLAQFDQFKRNVSLITLFLGGVFIFLIGGLALVDRQAGQALARSRRNERLAFLGRTSAELAHELKNPLGIIKSSVDVLRRRFDPAREQAAFDYLSEEVMRLSRLINNILGFSQDKPLQNRPFRPAEVLAEILQGYTGLFPRMDWRLEIGGEAEVTGDRDAFRLIAENLLRNAAKACQEEGRALMRLVKADGKARLLFWDNGPGLPPEVRARLFEPFVSGSKTGTGLGLAIVKNLCDRAGWRIRLRGRDPGPPDGYHTCFELEIPDRVAAGS